MEGEAATYLLGLLSYIRAQFEDRPIRAELEDLARSGKSAAGKLPEEVFTREFLCPTVADYFYIEIRRDLSLRDDQIEEGLGTAGFENCPRFGFTPARKAPHLFTKSDVIRPKAPLRWTNKAVMLPAYQACPDFAIRKPLPLSVVGEVKYFRGRTKDSAVKELYDCTRQAVFYLGAFRGEYDNALLVVADASPDNVFRQALLEDLNEELLRRFGEATGIFLVDIAIR
jgi:hypothetical protein